MTNEQQRWFEREKTLVKEIERLQSVEIESDLKICELQTEVKRLEKERDMWKTKAKEWELAD